MAKPLSVSELQLYRVLQRANLLQYFDTFICQGGDDVQQLCEAGEEEFLEIMALVGMASKPLHVRRLQKSLQEWVTNPALFHQPLGPHTPSPPVMPGSIMATIQVQRPLVKVEPPSPSISMASNSLSAISMAAAASAASAMALTPPLWGSQPPPALDRSSTPLSVPGGGDSDGGTGAGGNGLNGSFCSSQLASRSMMESPDSVNWEDRHTSSPRPEVQPILLDCQIKAIADAAADIAKTLPQYQRKTLNTKKTINQEIEEVLNLPEDLPEDQTMELLRKYAAIYGRVDKARIKEKPMTMHELSVNEAAAQLCVHRRNLLTRRDDLFPLARQVVRDSGYQYSKGHSRAQMIDIPPNKRPRMDRSPGGEAGKMTLSKYQREARLMEIAQELSDIASRQQEVKSQLHQSKGSDDIALLQSLQAELESLTSRQLQLLTEQGEIMHRQRRSRGNKYVRTNRLPGNDSQDFTEDEDSMTFPSGSSSPQNGLDYEAGDESALFQNLAAGRATNITDSKLGVKDSLLTEGLRIAQQYGMADFAEELHDLNQKADEHSSKDSEPHGGVKCGITTKSNGVTGVDGDTLDEQTAWTMEVEQDRIKQEHGQMAKTVCPLTSVVPGKVTPVRSPVAATGHISDHAVKPS